MLVDDFKKKYPDIPILDRSDFDSDEEFAEAFRKAIDAKPEDKIQVTTPQFDRSVLSPAIPLVPTNRASLDMLKTFKREELRALGMRPWEFADPELWLFPHEWYESIPAGYEVVDIYGERELFEPGVTDSDRRYGCLPYGVLVSRKDLDGEALRAHEPATERGREGENDAD